MDILCNLRKITEQKSAEKVLSQYFLVLKNIYYQIQDTAVVRFSSFFSGGFITALPERKLVKRMSLHGRTFIRNSAEKLVRWKF